MTFLRPKCRTGGSRGQLLNSLESAKVPYPRVGLTLTWLSPWSRLTLAIWEKSPFQGNSRCDCFNTIDSQFCGQFEIIQNARSSTLSWVKNKTIWQMAWNYFLHAWNQMFCVDFFDRAFFHPKCRLGFIYPHFSCQLWWQRIQPNASLSRLREVNAPKRSKAYDLHS